MEVFTVALCQCIVYSTTAVCRMLTQEVPTFGNARLEASFSPACLIWAPAGGGAVLIATSTATVPVMASAATVLSAIISFAAAATTTDPQDNANRRRTPGPIASGQPLFYLPDGTPVL